MLRLDSYVLLIAMLYFLLHKANNKFLIKDVTFSPSKELIFLVVLKLNNYEFIISLVLALEVQ